MSDEQNTDASASEASVGPAAGERLRQAREDRGLALEAVARELNLDTGRLRALESNRFDGLGAPVFVRGYLKKYASLVDVPPEAVLVEYEGLHEADGPPPVVAGRRSRRRSGPGARAVALGLVIAIVAGLGWWAYHGAVLKPRDEIPPPATIAGIESRETEVVAVSAVSATESVEPAPAVAGTLGSDVPVEATEALPLPPPEPVERTVALSFTDECWLELTDADGRRIYSGTARAGQKRTLSGVPPLSLVLGNADAVTVRVDGDPWPVNPSDRRGRTARITIPAP